MTEKPRKKLHSEAIAERIMTEMYEEVKDLMSQVIAERKEMDFDAIEANVLELGHSFTTRVLSEAMLWQW